MDPNPCDRLRDIARPRDTGLDTLRNVKARQTVWEPIVTTVSFLAMEIELLYVTALISPTSARITNVGSVEVFFSLVAVVLSVAHSSAQSSDVEDSSPGAAPPLMVKPPDLVAPIAPVIPVEPVSPIAPSTGPAVIGNRKTTGVDWSALLRESFAFLSLEHGFRYLTEAGTRDPHLAFFPGYAKSVTNLHGWADGDPFLVNYVGHPMQGAVTGFLFVENDRKYRMVEFGRNRWYWKSRLRAAAYSWAYSEQFEIGAISEASLGHVQAFFPQQGFVDQVATPSIGLGWMIVEDALDKYVIKPVDQRTNNGVIRMLVRAGLNPSRSMANAMSFEPPWHRIDRMDPWEPPRDYLMNVVPQPVHGEGEVHPVIPPFELVVNTRVLQGVGAGARGSCVGSGAMAAFHVSNHWQMVGDVGGCKMTAFGPNISGDSLTFMVGPRWIGNPEGQLEPFAQLLVGGRKLTHEVMDPEKKAQLAAILAAQGQKLSPPDHTLYTTDSEATGLAVSASAGLDVKLNPALALRLVDLGYMYSWHGRLDGINYSNTVQLTAGFILRLGTW